ncbi:chromosome segregation protein SMC [Thalassotalea sediminis]|uniref:chromosome segregation protein SMC n=1 Tax=Thalassotalea sediminis TaxID=1759089 RepID=UPI002572D4C9|nr:chromosome segregation protein SMC [Thalassotalea sediminis]
MRLKYIKLAGFKSFVDPTKVPFEQQMTAIVGPNGCGKSNIIDAVRWVLGESSAKNLRGDAMTDVIFNGAASRKPVGQASVELMFDNMAQSMQGSMADRNQVSIRRVVNRDAQSTYFLNGTKCRRKDITDIFLGTGLGPRSYAIIEQGTISRLIESKPQELRVFIEEAAGISKYKERRRETETRIRHTRENLARLTDIRFELNQQIDKLYQQAEAAKRFKTLKAEERQLKAELACLRWQNFDRQAQLKREKIQHLLDNINELNQTQKTDQALLANTKMQIQVANSQIQHCQQDKIKLTNNIARAEQKLAHEQSQNKQREERSQALKAQMAKTQKMLIHEQQHHANTQKNLDNYTQQIEILTAQVAEQETTQETLQDELHQFQLDWQQYNIQYRERLTAKNSVEQQRSVLTSALQQLQLQYTNISEQLSTLANEKALLANESLEDENALKGTILTSEEKQLDIKAVLKDTTTQSQLQAEKLSELRANIASKQRRLDDINHQLAQKEQWQKVQQTALAPLLQNEMSRIQELLEVEPGWELAVEMVLEHVLQAHVFESTWNDQCFDKIASLESCFIWFTDVSKDNTDNVSDASRLASKIKSEHIKLDVFSTIFIASDEAACIEKRATLSAHQSVICQQGFWLSHEFVRKGKLTQTDSALLLTNEQHQLQQDIYQLEKQLTQAQLIHENIASKIETLEQEQNDNSKQQANAQEQLLAVTQRNATWRQKCQHIEQQEQKLAHDLKLNTETIEDKERQINDIDTEEGGHHSLDDSELISTMTNIEAHMEQHRETLKDVTSQCQSLKESLHHQRILTERSKHQCQQAEQNISRYQSTIESIAEQQHNLEHHEGMPREELEALNGELQKWLSASSSLDKEIEQQHQVIVDQQVIFQQLEQNAFKIVEQIDQKKQTLSQLQLSAESFVIKAENALEQLEELGKNSSIIAQSLAENANESLWQAKLTKLQKDISMLGPINLAAIDEYESQLTRKNYLDQQDQDLNQAISTLESAIAKIDKESRQKFKMTFDKVNQDLQSLFPKVFGGGDAYLALTGDDLLETGVTIMARPPGKKNSTIHLLSGGEKALTALSLVFAIFRLNPAPFCMLDEVDAPLDDANVGRFCNLVREMSSTVQFIYISHNKIAMEMASHLTGVTMFEPGVSRMVAVDVDEAIAMADVS